MRQIAELLEFLTSQMTMAAIYQPAIILHLPERDGYASRAELVRTLSGHDRSDLDFWDRILVDVPKRRLFSLQHAERFMLSMFYNINLQAETYQITLHQGTLDHHSLSLVPVQRRCKLVSS